MELERGKPRNLLNIRGNEGKQMVELTGIEPATS
jgi:hypothetical protein